MIRTWYGTNSPADLVHVSCEFSSLGALCVQIILDITLALIFSDVQALL